MNLANLIRGLAILTALSHQANAASLRKSVDIRVCEAPRLSFNGVPTLHAGQSLALSWDASPDAAVASEGFSASGPSGSQTVTPACCGERTFRLRATTCGGTPSERTVEASVTALVVEPPPAVPPPGSVTGGGVESSHFLQGYGACDTFCRPFGGATCVDQGPCSGRDSRRRLRLACPEGYAPRIFLSTPHGLGFMTVSLCAPPAPAPAERPDRD